MRLLGHFGSEKEAAHFCRFLFTKEIRGGYEPRPDPKGGSPTFEVWVEKEEDFEAAAAHLENYQRDPTALEFQDVPPLDFSTQAYDAKGTKRKWVIDETASFSLPRFLTLTKLIVFICIGLFLWNAFAQVGVVRKYGPLPLKYGLTPVQQDLIFDYPYTFQELNQFLLKHATPQVKEIEELPPELEKEFKKIEDIPYWKGIYFFVLNFRETTLKEVVQTPMFEKIKKGEVWRFFTPCILHAGIIHILFNMLWLWVLGKQIESRIGVGRFILFILITGIVSNLAQYLMSGPFFMGFSGIVAAMVGFIYIRQKIAPWEGYPLQKAIIFFIFFFVLLMFVIQLVSFILEISGIAEFSINIANTAHVIGGLMGIGLGYSRFFTGEKS